MKRMRSVLETTEIILFTAALGLLLPGANKCYSQTTDKGEGTLKLVMYNIPSVDNAGIEKKTVFQTFTYFVKGDKILREDPTNVYLGRSTAEDQNIVSEFSASMLQPTYLLNLTEETAYLLYKDSTDTGFVYKSPLGHFTIEPFYKTVRDELAFRKNFHAFSVADPTGSASSKKWLMAIRVAPADTAYLEYEEKQWAVQSPLNIFLPDGITSGNVRRAFFKVDGTAKDNTPKKFFLMIEIEKVSGQRNDQSLFEIPSNAKHVGTLKELLDKYYE